MHLPSVLDLGSKRYIKYEEEPLNKKGFNKREIPAEKIETDLFSSNEFLAKFSQSGNRAITVSITCHTKSRKAYKFDLVDEQKYSQILSFLQIDKKSLDGGVLQPILVDVLTMCSSEKKVRGIDFLGRSENLICLVFDDEVLSLQFREGRFIRSFRIEIQSSHVDNGFLGIFNEAYVFGGGLEQNEYGGIKQPRLCNVEYVEKGRIFEIVGGSEKDGIQAKGRGQGGVKSLEGSEDELENLKD